MYRTAEQDERLNNLYKEQEQVEAFASTHPRADCSGALAAIEREIESLTAGLDVPPRCGGELVTLENAAKYDFTPAPNFDINWDDVEEVEIP